MKHIYRNGEGELVAADTAEDASRTSEYGMGWEQVDDDADVRVEFTVKKARDWAAGFDTPTNLDAETSMPVTTLTSLPVDDRDQHAVHKFFLKTGVCLSESQKETLSLIFAEHRARALEPVYAMIEAANGLMAADETLATVNEELKAELAALKETALVKDDEAMGESPAEHEYSEYVADVKAAIYPDYDNSPITEKTLNLEDACKGYIEVIDSELTTDDDAWHWVSQIKAAVNRLSPPAPL